MWTFEDSVDVYGLMWTPMELWTAENINFFEKGTEINQILRHIISIYFLPYYKETNAFFFLIKKKQYFH